MPRLSWSLIALLLLAVLVGCTPDDETTSSGTEAPGVTENEIRLGSSLALTGHAGYLGTQTLCGAQSYLRYVNDNGGVYGRKIRIVAQDDSYDPPRCLANTQRFIIENDTFALFSYVGTPTTVKVLPLVEEAKVPLIGMFTGANGLREPFNRYVVNIRPSYYQETEDAIRHMVRDLGLRRIAVFYQFDAYGFDGLIGAELALKQFDLEPVARGSYIRGTLNITEGLEKIRQSRAEGVVMVGTYGACARFIIQSLDSNYSPVFYNVSFVGAEELARLLEGHKPKNVIMSQVVPSPAEAAGSEGAAALYVQLLKQYYPNDPPSFVGLEGFLNAMVLVEGLRKAGPDLSRERFIDAIESIQDFQLGPNLSVTYGPNDRQGLDTIYFTRLEKGRFVPLKDWNELKVSLEAAP